MPAIATTIICTQCGQTRLHNCGGMCKRCYDKSRPRKKRQRYVPLVRVPTHHGPSREHSVRGILLHRHLDEADHMEEKERRMLLYAIDAAADRPIRYIEAYRPGEPGPRMAPPETAEDLWAWVRAQNARRRWNRDASPGASSAPPALPDALAYLAHLAQEDEDDGD